jgi:hypothetical protein
MNDPAGGQAGDDDAHPLLGGEGGEPAENDASGSWTALPTSESPRPEPAQGMIPARARRRTMLERGSMRVLATGGIIGLATILGAVLVSEDVAGLTSVILAALLWSSRQL